MKNIGIIGCGGRLRAILQQMLNKSSDFNVVGLFDPSSESIEKTQSMLSIKAKVYDDYNNLTEAEDIDWVMIGSWNCFHKEQIISAVKNGKHIFCEKPLATTAKDCIEIKKAIDKSNLMCVMGFTLRFSPHYRKIKELVGSGCVGSIISLEMSETLDFNHGGYIHSDWRRFQKNAGTHLLEKCCHDIDILNWIVGRTPNLVAGFGGNDFFIPSNANYVDKVGKSSDGRIAYLSTDSTTGLNPFTCDKDIYDNQVAVFDFNNGPRATFHTNCNSGIPERRLYICGTDGAIRSDVISGRIEYAKIGWDSKIIDYSTGVRGGHGGGDDLLADELIAAMFYGEMPAATFEEGFNAAIVCFAADKATIDKSVVNIDDFLAGL